MFAQDFANQNNVYTMLPKDTTQAFAMGQRSELSFYDHKIVNLAYCDGRKTLIFVFRFNIDLAAVVNDIVYYIFAVTPAVCHIKLPCQNGGYTDPKNCQVCRCPDGWGGTLCDQVYQGSAGNYA